MLFYISDSIIAKIEQAGFTIAMSKEMMLSREQAETFYEEHKGSDFFETLVTNMTRFVLNMWQISLLYLKFSYPSQVAISVGF